MAKITVEFDTVEKTMTCAVDGKALDNIQMVMFSTGYDDEYCCEIGMGMESKDDNMRTYTRICAAESAKGRELAAAGVTPRGDLPGFLSLPHASDADAEMEAEVLDFWGKGK